MIRQISSKLDTLTLNAPLFAARLAGQKVVVFYCRVGATFTYMESLWNSLRTTSGARCWVAVERRHRTDTISFLRKRGLHGAEMLVLDTAHSLKCVDLFFRSAGEGTPDCKCERVQVFHGLAGWGCSKSNGVDPNMDSLATFNHLFLTGPNQERIIREQYFSRHPEMRNSTMLHQIGYPKTDALLTGTYARNTIIDNYKLDPHKAIVLYAPTWEKEASLHAHGEEILAGLAALDASVLIKPHPYSLSKPQPRPDGEPWGQFLVNFCRQHSHCRLVTDADSNPYLAAADVLVTDVSGIGFEYLLLDKPIIYYDCPFFFALYGTGGIEYWGRSAGQIVTSAEDLRKAVQVALTEPDRFRSQREQITSQLVFNPGRATDAAVRAAHEILGLPA